MPATSFRLRQQPDFAQDGAREVRVAVLLNANAKQVNEKVRAQLAEALPEGDLYFTRTLEEAQAVAERVVAEGYPAVLTGGGDGTFVGFFNELVKALERRAFTAGEQGTATAPLPRIGILRLGTGNALASQCHASPKSKMLEDLRRVRSGEVTSAPLDLIETGKALAPFAGIGLDAGVLNHYVETKGNLGKGPLSRLFSGGGGYAAAIVFRSVPTYLIKHRPRIQVRNRGIAYRIDASGNPEGPRLGPGAILYEGPALIASAGTIPFYGYGFRMFPLAGTRHGLMHFRVGNPSIPRVLVNVYPNLWKGRWHHESVFDFLCDDIEIQAEEKVPFQIGGDAAGYCENVRFSTWKKGCELIDFGGVHDDTGAASP